MERFVNGFPQKSHYCNISGYLPWPPAFPFTFFMVQRRLHPLGRTRIAPSALLTGPLTMKLLFRWLLLKKFDHFIRKSAYQTHELSSGSRFHHNACLAFAADTLALYEHADKVVEGYSSNTRPGPFERHKEQVQRKGQQNEGYKVCSNLR